MKHIVTSPLRLAALAPSRLAIALLAVCSMVCTNAAAQRVISHPGDSAMVERMLAEARRQPKDTNIPLYFAKQFLGKPYVGHTLEQGDPECLVVNMEELDCTTYVDVVSALTVCHRRRLGTWADFCRQLRMQRYPNGVIDGYISRNHYFSQWIYNAARLGFAREIGKADCKGGYNPFRATQTLDLHFMSSHPDQYDALSRHPEWVEPMAAIERSLSGRKADYIPTAQLNAGRSKLGCIRNGDIILIVLDKFGLDIAHMGVAQWDGQGRLHMIHASSAKKRVVLDNRTMYKYMTDNKRNVGIRVLRIL